MRLKLLSASSRYQEDFTCDLFLYRFTFVSVGKYWDFEFRVHTQDNVVPEKIYVFAFFFYVKQVFNLHCALPIPRKIVFPKSDFAFFCIFIQLLLRFRYCFFQQRDRRNVMRSQAHIQIPRLLSIVAVRCYHYQSGNYN